MKKELPKRCYFKHGRYWYVYQNKWTPLSKDKDEATQEADKLNIAYQHGGTPTLHTVMLKAFNSRKSDAASRNIPFSIMLSDVISLAEDTKWRCSLTGISLTIDKPDGAIRAPFSPSIDRIKPSEGYIISNIRIVCLAANLAMNEWGDEILKQLAEGWINHQH